MNKERSSNIELLRIIIIIGVIILHINNRAIGGAFNFTEGNVINSTLLYVIESFFICSVNVFIIISGYFLCKSKKRDFWKVISLIFQVIFFKVVVYGINCILNFEIFSFKTLIINCLPTNYFVILYCVLYIISIYFNKVINILSKKELKRMLIIFLIIFAFYNTIIDVGNSFLGNILNPLSSIGAEGTQAGYTIVNFSLMYILGAYIRISEIEKKIKKRYLIISLIICVALLSVWAKFDEITAWEYCNIAVIFEAICLFMLFLKIDLKTNKFINSLAGAAFTVFLVHTFFFKFVDINYFVTKNPIVLILFLVIFAMLIYVISWIIYLIYNKINNLILNKLKSWKDFKIIIEEEK